MEQLTKTAKCGKMAPELRFGDDLILKLPYAKGKSNYTSKLVRVCDGAVYALDPATKEQILIGRALWLGDVLVMALSVHRES